MNQTATPASAPAVPSADLALQRLYHWERTQPDRVAFTQPIGGGQVVELRWGQVLDQARRVAAWLRRQGCQPGDRVAMLAKNTAHWMVTDYAIWLAGGVSVPLYPTLAPETIRQILTHSGARWLFVGKLDGWDHMSEGVPDGLPCIAHPLAPDAARQRFACWEDLLESTAPLAGEPVRDAGELSTIMYTSGTTGMPKGVMHSFGNFAAAVKAGLSRIPLREDSRMLSYLPLSHVVERALVEHGQLATGMQVYFAESLDTFAADLQRARPTVFFSVPRLWVKFQQGVHHKLPPARLDLLLKLPIIGGIVRRKVLGTLGLDHCEFAAGGAAPMPQELLRWFQRLGLNVAEGYGMTENVGASHLTDGNPADFGTVGHPYPGVECRIDAASGEILVRAPWTMLGYYREPALTAAALTADGWLCTGDQGRIDGQGRLHITGRVKDLFKTSKGKYVAPAPIEDRLVMHPAIEACCVTGANLGQPIALVMLESDSAGRATGPGRTDLEADLAAHLAAVNAGLDPHEQLGCLVVTREAWTVDNDLITPTFKVKRNRIEAVYAARFGRWSESGRRVVWQD